MSKVTCIVFCTSFCIIKKKKKRGISTCDKATAYKYISI